MKIVSKTNVGKVREKNEDYYHVSENLPLFILADGMGGHLAGETASATAVKTIVNEFESKKIKEAADVKTLIEESIEFANKVVFDLANSVEKYKGMGTTLSIAYIFEKQFIYANVGDSRIYELDKEGIRKLTRDDTYVNYLLDIGEITEEEARVHPNKNVLTLALGTEKKLKVNIQSRDIEGKKFLLCSDGLTNMVKEEDIYKLLMENELEDAGNMLMEKALDNGGVDNITFILIDTSRCESW